MASADAGSCCPSSRVQSGPAACRRPKGNVFEFDYENDGRLKKHTDPPEAGRERLFLRDNQPNGTSFGVEVTTKTGPGMGDKLETTYQVENLLDGVERRTNILPGGLKATTEIEPNGKRTTTFPDGTTTTLIDKGDQRFGMQAPIISSLEISTGGLTQVADNSRTSTPLPMLAMSNDASFALGLAKYRQGICQIGAGTMEATGRMQIIAGAITLGTALAAKVNPLNATRYTDKVRAQMRRNPRTGRPDNHGFPLEVDNSAALGRQTTVKGGDGVVRTKIELDGSYNGKDGVFEWIIEADGTVNHRLFRPGEGAP